MRWLFSFHCSTNCNFEIASLSLIFFSLFTIDSCPVNDISFECDSKMIPIHGIPMGFRFQVSRSSHRKKLYLISRYRDPSRLYDSLRPFDLAFYERSAVGMVNPPCGFSRVSRHNRHHADTSVSSQRTIPLSNLLLLSCSKNRLVIAKYWRRPTNTITEAEQTGFRRVSTIHSPSNSCDASRSIISNRETSYSFQTVVGETVGILVTYIRYVRDSVDGRRLKMINQPILIHGTDFWVKNRLR